MVGPVTVSVVIPFYNCPYVDQAIESALGQTYPYVEVIVVNDGSHQYKEKIVPYMPRIRYVEKANGGTATALNMGIRYASGQYFAWLSADDVFDREKIAKQLQWMQQHRALASFTAYRLIDANGRVIGQPSSFWLADRARFFEHMKQHCLINGSTVMLHMDIFRQVGLFDESLRYAHDYEFWLRVLLYHHFQFVPERLLSYRVHEQMGTVRHTQHVLAEAALVQAKYRHISLR
ncbi:MAG: hypothetical protein A6D91_07335 [Bacillaceae bacterium G1]|nr:glycosyl transferase [Bacillota bacterium]OJF17935.1 MAG: hypothetical protein A6D91_07335 [Bacillaceae bacterium G1]